MTAPRGRCDRPSTPTDPMNNDTVTVSRSRYEGLFVLAITGWALALILIGAEIGRNQ